MGEVLVIVLISVVAVVMMLVLQRLIVRHVARTSQVNRVVATGTPTTAVVLGTYDTGRRIDTIYVMVRLQLKVEAGPDLAEFESESVVPISPVKLADFAVGRTVMVRVDPATREVAVDQPVR